MPTAVAKAQAKNSKIGIACIIRRAGCYIVNNITMLQQKKFGRFSIKRKRYQPKLGDLKRSYHLDSLAHSIMCSSEVRTRNHILELPCPRPNVRSIFCPNSRRTQYPDHQTICKALESLLYLPPAEGFPPREPVLLISHRKYKFAMDQKLCV